MYFWVNGFGAIGIWLMGWLGEDNGGFEAVWDGKLDIGDSETFEMFAPWKGCGTSIVDSEGMDCMIYPDWNCIVGLFVLKACPWWETNTPWLAIWGWPGPDWTPRCSRCPGKIPCWTISNIFSNMNFSTKDQVCTMYIVSLSKVHVNVYVELKDSNNRAIPLICGHLNSWISYLTKNNSEMCRISRYSVCRSRKGAPNYQLSEFSNWQESYKHCMWLWKIGSIYKMSITHIWQLIHVQNNEASYQWVAI